MLAARVCLIISEWVTIVEKDRYPSSVARERCSPIATPARTSTSRLQIVSRLFPGIDKELVAAGAVPVDVARDFAWYTSAGWAVNFDSGMEMLSFTRELLDWHIRQRVEACRTYRFSMNAALWDSLRIVARRREFFSKDVAGPVSTRASN
jgi:hypothetical protein